MKRSIIYSIKGAAVALAALVAAFVLPACSHKQAANYDNFEGSQQYSETLPEAQGDYPESGGGQGDGQGGGDNSAQTAVEIIKARYIIPSAEGVNLRAGAGTSYKILGSAQMGTLYALEGKEGNWFETLYKNGRAYISAAYCTVAEIDCCGNADIENVIAEGCKLLGTPYVYGATRMHDGSGNMLSGFKTSAFDCSSLMQYIFKVGADVNLQVTTRTQVYQGVAVADGDLRRGDVMFFTNSSRKNLKGTERIGHVALYLGDNYILHTASDFAKIERISSARWANFICARRILG